MRVHISILAALLCWSVADARPADSAPRHCSWERPAFPPPDAPLALSCRLRTVAGAPTLLADLTPMQADRISSLSLTCNDVLFFESSLEISKRPDDPPGFLSKLKRLRELLIEHCKIRYIPASVFAPLKELRALTLKTHNSEWSAMTMEFHQDSFKGLGEMRQLDLSDNNIRSLPAEVFCPLYSLKELNFTKNRLRDISQMGFSDWGDGPTAPGKSCNTALETLDVSHNDIQSLPDNGLSSLRSLQKLLLQDNSISLIADRAFVGLNALQILNLSSNSLVALPPEMFQSSRDIKQIYLNNNSINVLAPGLLEGLDQLMILDMSQNELNSEWVNRDTFSGLIRLVVLNLSNNKITKIDSLMFQDLNNLQFLSLENNKIMRISEGAFSSLKNVHSLSLSHNKLTHIDSHHFSNFYVLDQLFLEENRIVSIHPRSFENITKLSDLVLNGNNLGEIPEAVKNLRFLKSLDLGKNDISVVESAHFEGLDNLFALRLFDNSIVNITKDAFATLPSLQILNLASNKIKFIDRQAFGSNSTVKALRLDMNELTDIRGVFVNMNYLGWLNISNNDLVSFDYGQMPPSLEWLDMHQNRIQKLENHLDLKTNINIKMLNVGHNQLTSIDESSLPGAIELLFLNNNNINRVNSGTFLRKPNLQKVVLYGNKIQTIDISAFALSPVSEDRDLPEFFIGGNPFHCDCTMEWLQRINHLSRSRQHPRVTDLETVTCTLTHSRGKESEFLLDLKPSQFLCPYETHCFALCHCCEFDACDCEMTCPDRCSCYHDLTWSSNVVDCSNAGFDKVPSRIPMDATEIYLDGNNFKELGNHVFIGKKKLQTLYLNNSNIDAVNNRTFNGIDSLKILHLENNNIEKLDGMEFNKLDNLIELHLEDNKIKTIHNETFSSLSSLGVLKLDNNGIVDFLPWKIVNDASAVQTKVSLRGNKWQCDCEKISELEHWLVVHSEDVNVLVCHTPDGQPTNNTIASVILKCKKAAEESTVGSVTQRHLFLDSSKLVENYIPYVAVVSVLTIIILLFCVLLFLFREEFRLWVHSKYGVRVFTCSAKKLNDVKDRNFDAYVVYSLRDDDFVSRAFAAELEQTGHSLCLHHRDLQVSERCSDDSIVNGVENSKRLIIVLSISFLQNEWYKPEFKSALQSGINSVNASHRRQKIIFIVTTDLSALTLDPDLKALLKTCTVIVWGEKNCREKLNFRLPDAKLKSPHRTVNNVTKHVNVDVVGGVGSKNVNMRYTASPTCHDTWYKYYGRGSPGVATPSPTQSTCVSGVGSEDEGCWDGSGSGPLDHSYASIDSREVRPLRKERAPPPPPHNRKTYFV